jgi:ribosomal protein S18 acetylase RimI-like enzyme
VEYRQLQLTDHAGLMALWQRCEGISLRDADSVESMQKYLLRNPGLSFVADQQGQIVGSLMAGHDGRRGYIQHLAVADEHRRQGIAGQLLEHCLAALAAQGIVKSHVHVIHSNRLGIEFWTRRGWTHRGEIEMYSFVNGDNPNA